MLLFFLLGVFLLLPDCFLMSIPMLVLPDDIVGVRVVRPDDDSCAKSLVKHLDNFSSGVPALSGRSRCFWRSVGSDDEADDAGGHTHGDLSLPELLHDGKDVPVGSLVVPVPGLVEGTG